MNILTHHWNNKIYTSIFSIILFLANSYSFAFCQVSVPLPIGPVPTGNQMKWQQLEYYAFVHLSVNTYTDMAWGNGNESPEIFNPAKLDCRKWARICKDAGMKALILTAKHHSGFCLWPSKYTEYSVKNSPWKNGKGDIVREMSDACKEYGLKFGIYLSPWDRNSADYGKPEYIVYFRNQLRELLSNYGDIFEIWFDGANGGTGYYGGANENRKIDRNTYYDWKNTYALARSLQPNIVIWNDGGDRADLRWVGTESGYVGETNWSLLDSTGDVPEQMLRNGLENGNKWVPGEVNTSIRPEWFYHKKEDDKVKTMPQLMDIYYNSIGRNATLLMNFPIMPNGLIHPIDQQVSQALAKEIKKVFTTNLAKKAKAAASNIRGGATQFNAAKAIDESKETYWSTDDNAIKSSLTLSFEKPQSFNRFLIQEYIALGQRVKSFTVNAMVNGEWKQIASETTIGYKRILRFSTVTATKIRLDIIEAKGCPLIANIELFNAPVILAPPTIIREQSGAVRITPADMESQVYYSLDGSNPTIKATKYTGTFKTGDGKLVVKSIAFDQNTKKSSPVKEENFEISRKFWKIVGVDDENRQKILDGDPNTEWYQKSSNKMPLDLVIDLGKLENASGFKYLPDQHWWASGIITNYKFFVSVDGNEWTQIDEGEFSNIKNNPVMQTKSFPQSSARYIKFQAIRNTKGDDVVGYAEIDVITQ